MINELLRKLLFLPGQWSTIAFDIDKLHYFVISVTMAGATLVALFAAYLMFRYRRRQRDVEGPFPGATARPPLLLEVGMVLGLIVLFLVWWVIGMRQYAALRVAPADPVVVYVTGKQWMWKFAYPEGPSSVATLYVPARRPVKLVMTSRDVIHSFFVPDFRIKYDVVPGRYTTLWFEATAPGAYQILCTEYCGTNHSTMRGEVIALEPSDFARWLSDRGRGAGIAGQEYTPPSTPGEGIPREPLSLVRLGENIAAEEGCLRCHTPDGTPHIGPTWAGLYMSVVPLESGGAAVADDAYITESMMDPLARIHRGYQRVMPSFLGRLQPAQVAAIVEYIRSLRGVAPEPGARTPLPEGPPFLRSGPERPAPLRGGAPVGPIEGGKPGEELR
ncbi:cytochrome c oxidase subunit II [Sorangium sp. So ce296]|uniref:cytochrome c oxidase subunit II n=1 Tax=Sorangium sp. So ce296 TaxID=3133296 RepID=UPI003F61B995